MSVLTTGWVARHARPGAGGRYAALIDIAHDLLLAPRHRRNVVARSVPRVMLGVLKIRRR